MSISGGHSSQARVMSGGLRPASVLLRTANGTGLHIPTPLQASWETSSSPHHAIPTPDPWLFPGTTGKYL